MIVIIQGPVNSLNIAKVVISNVKALCNIHAVKKIIINTYRNTETENLMLMIQSDRVIIKFYADPGCKLREPIRNVPLNLDRQMLTSALPSDVQVDSSEIIMKIRSDLRILKAGSILLKLLIRRWVKFESKVYVLPITTTKPKDLRFPRLQVCDWLYIMRADLYVKVFSPQHGEVSHEETLSYIENGMLTFGNENYIANLILKESNRRFYNNMWDVNLEKWDKDFSEVFGVLPYIGCFASTKYRNMLPNLRFSPTFIRLKTTLNILIVNIKGFFNADPCCSKSQYR